MNLTICRAAMGALLVIVYTARAAEEIPVTPKIESVALFKNGLTVIRASFPAAAAGIYRWERVPRVVHGTFAVDSAMPVSVRTTLRMLEETEAAEYPTGVLQTDLAGQTVEIRRRPQAGQTDAPAPVRGKVIELQQRTPERHWDVDYSSLNSGSNYYYGYWRPAGSGPVAPPAVTTGSLLLLEDEKGARTWLDTGSIGSIHADGPFAPKKKREEKSVMLFEVPEAKPDGVIRLTWLSKGMTWVPSYQILLRDGKQLDIEQSAVLRNEMMPLQDTEIQLISGFPNVRFATVDSPLWPGTSLTSFFNQVNQSGQISAAGGIMSNSMSQQVYSRHNEVPASGLDMNAPGEGASTDLHYESVGKRTLEPGDSLSLRVAAASAEYERVVEWKVQDRRDEYGRWQQPGGREQPVEEAWDAVRFNNPFRFPMTTAAASLHQNGQFLGQTQSDWVNPGDSNCLRITRALSVTTAHAEVEEEASRERVEVRGRSYRRSIVKGTCTVHNYRKEDVAMYMTAEYSGEFISAEGDPAKSLRPEGVPWLNARRKLDWKLTLEPGEERTVTYRYSVLIHE